MSRPSRTRESEFGSPERQAEIEAAVAHAAQSLEVARDPYAHTPAERAAAVAVLQEVRGGFRDDAHDALDAAQAGNSDPTTASPEFEEYSKYATNYGGTVDAIATLRAVEELEELELTPRVLDLETAKTRQVENRDGRALRTAELYAKRIQRQDVLRKHLIAALAEDREIGGELRIRRGRPRSAAGQKVLADTGELFPKDMLDRLSENEFDVRYSPNDERVSVRPTQFKSFKVETDHVADLSRLVGLPSITIGALSGSFSPEVSTRATVPGGGDEFTESLSVYQARANRTLHASSVPDTTENRSKAERIATIYGRAVGVDAMPSIEKIKGEDGSDRIVLVRRGAGLMPAKLASKTKLMIFNDAPHDTAHETSHLIEAANPDISRACKSFLAKRARDTGAKFGPLGPPYDKSERAYIGAGFANKYIGKDYPGTESTEIFSTGVESVMFGQYRGLIGDKYAVSDIRAGVGEDRNHRSFIIGLLATASTPKD